MTSLLPHMQAPTCTAPRWFLRPIPSRLGATVFIEEPRRGVSPQRSDGIELNNLSGSLEGRTSGAPRMNAHKLKWPKRETSAPLTRTRGFNGTQAGTQARSAESLLSLQPRRDQNRVRYVSNVNQRSLLKSEKPDCNRAFCGFSEAVNFCNQTYAGVLSVCANTLSDSDKSDSR